MTKKSFLFGAMFMIALLSLYGCEGSDPAPVDFNDIIDDPDGPDGPDTPVAPPGELGDLTDLGDLVEPAGAPLPVRSLAPVGQGPNRSVHAVKPEHGLDLEFEAEEVFGLLG